MLRKKSVRRSATDLIAYARVPGRRRLIDAHPVAAEFGRRSQITIVFLFRTMQSVPIRGTQALVTTLRVLTFRPVLTSQVRVQEPRAFVYVRLAQSPLCINVLLINKIHCDTISLSANNINGLINSYLESFAEKTRNRNGRKKTKLYKIQTLESFLRQNDWNG